MAGKPKKRIDYAGWSVDIFSNDIKIDKLLDAQGWTGFGIYFYLCQMAFGGEGYYYEWCYDLCATTARKMGGGVGAGTVKETVDYCLHIGLFDERLFDRCGVLTSRGIQKSYLAVVKGNSRRTVEIYKDYWLLDISESEECQGVVFIRKNNSKLGAKDDLQEENGYLQGADGDSIVLNNTILNNKNTMCKADTLAQIEELFKKLWKLYPVKKGKGQVSRTQKMKLFKIGYEEMSRAIDRYLEELKKDEWRKPQNGSTFFNRGYMDYLDEYYVSGKQPTVQKPKNRFHNFEQRNTDYDAIMLEHVREWVKESR